MVFLAPAKMPENLLAIWCPFEKFHASRNRKKNKSDSYWLVQYLEIHICSNTNHFAIRGKGGIMNDDGTFAIMDETDENKEQDKNLNQL